MSPDRHGPDPNGTDESARPNRPDWKVAYPNNIYLVILKYAKVNDFEYCYSEEKINHSFSSDKVFLIKLQSYRCIRPCLRVFCIIMKITFLSYFRSFSELTFHFSVPPTPSNTRLNYGGIDLMVSWEMPPTTFIITGFKITLASSKSGNSTFVYLTRERKIKYDYRPTGLVHGELYYAIVQAFSSDRNGLNSAKSNLRSTGTVHLFSAVDRKETLFKK